MKDRRILAIDRMLFELQEKYLHRIVLFLLFAGSVLIRIKLTPELSLSPDYDFYEEWTGLYRELGFVQGMRQVIGDYYVPFNIVYAAAGLLTTESYIVISAFSCLFDYLIAFLSYLLALRLFGDKGVPEKGARLRAAYVAALVCYLPFMFMNSALWKQADGVYVFFALAAVYALIKDKSTAAFILLGISFSFKLQMIFFMPFFCLMYLVKKNFSILKFLWIPGVYLIAGLPAVILKRGLKNTYGTYFLQMQEGTGSSENYGLVSFYPNLYNFGLDDFLETMALPAVLMTFLLLLLSVVLVLRARVILNTTTLLWVLAWQIWTCVMFLPSMHERYDYGAVLLFSLLAFSVTGRGSWHFLLPASLLNVCTFINYMRVMRVLSLPIEWECILYTACWIFEGGCLACHLRGCRFITKEAEG